MTKHGQYEPLLDGADNLIEQFTMPFPSILHQGAEIDSSCIVRIFKTLSDVRIVVISEDVLSNQGQSVTNAYEKLSGMLVTQGKVDPSTTIWVEHYPHRGDAEETFDRVYLKAGRNWQSEHFQVPEWRHMGRDKFLQLIGETP